MNFTSIDLFAGPGGICTGFKWADIKPLIAVEWSDRTVETYASSHNADVLPLEELLNGTFENKDLFFLPTEENKKRTVLIHGDIRKVSNELIDEILNKRFEVKSVDIVTGGAPCESFSMAGQRNEEDERNDLFLNILRVARHIDSKMILFENVKGLFSKKIDGIPGKMFEMICDEFERLDEKSGVSYKLASRHPKEVLLTASDFGVPQQRQRIFLVGINNKFKSIFKYPEPTHGEERKYPYVTVDDALMDLPQIERNDEATHYDYNIADLNEGHRFEFLSTMRGITFPPPDHIIFDQESLSSHKSVNHRDVMVERFKHIREGESQKTAVERLILEGKPHVREEYFPKKLYGARCRRLVKNRPSFTVTSHCLDEMIHPVLHRQLTPREAARLQSFPDWYRFQGPYVKFHSDPEQDRYEQIGDAIPPLLAYNLALEVHQTLKQIYLTKVETEKALM